MTLYEDVVEVLGAWVPPDEEQAGVRQRFLELLGSAPAAVSAGHPGAHITASVLVLRADLRQVLLCLHGRIRRWVQLGGHLEPVDATLADAALREATEESGITGIRIDPMPIHLDVHPVQCRTGPAQHYDVRFAAIAPAGAVPVVSDESLELGWFAPDALPEPLASGTAPLVPLALARYAARATPGAR